MKLNILGSGSIGAKDMSASSIIDNHILIDVPNGIVKYLKNLNYSILDIDTIFITHLHGDHFADLPFFMLEKYFYKSKNKTKIICPKDTLYKTKQLFEILFPNNFEKIINEIDIDFIELEKEEEITVNNIKVRVYLVEHGNIKPAFGYVLEKDDKKIGFSGDSILCDAINSIVYQSDVAVLDMSVVSNETVMHMGYKDVNKICLQYPNKKIIATHMHDFTRETALSNPISNLIIPTKNFEILL